MLIQKSTTPASTSHPPHPSANRSGQPALRAAPLPAPALASSTTANPSTSPANPSTPTAAPSTSPPAAPSSAATTHRVPPSTAAAPSSLSILPPDPHRARASIVALSSPRLLAHQTPSHARVKSRRKRRRRRSRISRTSILRTSQLPRSPRSAASLAGSRTRASLRSGRRVRMGRRAVGIILGAGSAGRVGRARNWAAFRSARRRPSRRAC